MTTIKDVIQALPGPVLVIGAGGFIGANLFRTLLQHRPDAYGTIHVFASWRLEGVTHERLLHMDLLLPESVSDIMEKVRPAVVFNCSSYGAYSFEKDIDRIHRTNYNAIVNLLELCVQMNVKALINTGTSSEYGQNCAGPKEDAPLVPDSHYAVSKAATSHALVYYGQVRGLPCLNLRLYSVYGPYEDSSRLMPVLCQSILRGTLPPFVHPDTSRDFIYVDDAVEALVYAAARIGSVRSGAVYNIGTGRRVSIRDLANMAKEQFNTDGQPEFNRIEGRLWDHPDWYADATRAREELGWQAQTSLAEGLEKTLAWWRDFLTGHSAEALTKQVRAKSKSSLSVVVACYRDAEAIPVMYERLTRALSAADLDYEIIFINDGSPDKTSEAIVNLSAKDPRVIGIVHSRNFGSQAAFRSGMEISTKEACVLMDGDLQDPPELIPAFVERWRVGADVVYGRRIKREMPCWLEIGYKAFYRVLASLSEFPIPKDAGDFSLIDRNVVRWILQCQERDQLLRGLRAYVGFRQEGIDYVRPERMFGRSTNNLIKNIGWAKKAIFSFSRAPLHLLTFVGTAATLISILLVAVMAATKLIWPEQVPHGIPTVLLLVSLFGSMNLLGLGLLGEYIGKIIEETKKRPHFIRVQKIERGETLPWQDTR